MEKKGMIIFKTTDRARAREIAQYIWNFTFKKSIPVDVAVYDDAPLIDAYVVQDMQSKLIHKLN